MNIKETAQKYSDYIIETRRYLHMHPELSTKEYETSKFVQSELDKIGVPYVQCGLETGVLATIKGGKPGKTILIRGDMDALPVPEENDLSYKSTVDGVMHACGHDTHTAMMLTAAHILNDVKDELCGTVKLAFQPSEETAQGAPSMIENGAMEGVDAVYGQHIWTQVPTGKVAFAAGPRMASAGQFEIWVQGKGGHGAEPHNCHDAVTCCAAIVNSLQTIVSREYRPIDAAVCTVGRMDVGTRWNVIADSGYLAGTTRCFDRQVFAEFPERIERIVKGTCEAYRRPLSTMPTWLISLTAPARRSTATMTATRSPSTRSPAARTSASSSMLLPTRWGLLRSSAAAAKQRTPSMLTIARSLRLTRMLCSMALVCTVR